MVLETFARQASLLLANIFGPDSFISTIISENPIIAAVTFIVLLVLIIGAPILFFDFIVDAWKIPFAVIVDLGVFFAFSNPILVIPAILCCFFVFILLVGKKNKPLAWTLGLISASLASTLLFLDPNLVFVAVIAFLPINTALMFIGAVLD